MITTTVMPLPVLTEAARRHRLTGVLRLDTVQNRPEVIETTDDGSLVRVPVGAIVEGEVEPLHGAALTLYSVLRVLREQLLIAVANGTVRPDQVEALDELADLETAHAASVGDDAEDTEKQLRALQQATEGRGILLGHARARHLLTTADELGAAQHTGTRGRSESGFTRAARAAGLAYSTANSLVARYERRRAAWSKGAA